MADGGSSEYVPIPHGIDGVRVHDIYQISLTVQELKQLVSDELKEITYTGDPRQKRFAIASSIARVVHEHIYDTPNRVPTVDPYQPRTQDAHRGFADCKDVSIYSYALAHQFGLDDAYLVTAKTGPEWHVTVYSRSVGFIEGMEGAALPIDEYFKKWNVDPEGTMYVGTKNPMHTVSAMTHYADYQPQEATMIEKELRLLSEEEQQNGKLIIFEQIPVEDFLYREHLAARNAADSA